MAGEKTNRTNSATRQCPLCGGHEFGKPKGPKKNRCVECGSNERVRSSWLLLRAFADLREGSRVLHLAPEIALARRLHQLCGYGYEARDLNAAVARARPDSVQISAIDPLLDIPRMETCSYDAVVHNHLLPALACDYSAVLRHLHGLLKPGGIHVFSVPVSEGYYREDMDPAIQGAARSRRFGQPTHFRSFGIEDIDRTLGAALGVPLSEYRLDWLIDPESLQHFAIPPNRWGVRGGAVLAIQRT